MNRKYRFRVQGEISGDAENMSELTKFFETQIEARNGCRVTRIDVVRLGEQEE